MRFLPIVLLAPLLVTGCPSATVAPAPTVVADPAEKQAHPTPAAPTRESILAARLAEVAPIRQQVRDLVTEQQEQLWKAATQRAPFDAAAAWKGREELLSPATLARVRAAREVAAGPEARALELVETFLVGELVARSTAEIAQQRSEIENTAIVKVGDDETPWGDVDRRLANLPGADERARLFAARKDVLVRLAPLVLKEEAAGDDALRVLGIESRAKYLQQLLGGDLDELAAIAEQVLATTDETYRKAADRLATSRMALPYAKLHASDLPRLFAAPSTEGAFPSAKLIANATIVGRSFGIALKGQPGLRFDDADVATKTPRPLCVAVNPPSDVRISTRPMPGADAMRLLMKAVGQAAPALLVDQPQWELRALGRDATQATIAALAESLVTNRAWVESAATLKGAELATYLREATTRRLFDVRRAAARTLFSIRIAKGEKDPAAAWKTIFTRALALDLTDADVAQWPLDAEPWADSAEVLRARVLAAQLELFLGNGGAWWTAPNTPALLRPLFALGALLTTNDFLSVIQAPKLDAAPLAAALSAGAN